MPDCTFVGGTDAGGGSGLTTLSFAHTVGAGADRMLLVGVLGSSGDNITGVTYNGVAMTLVVKQNYLIRYVYLFYLVAPASGAHNVVVSAGSGGIWATAVDYENAVQTAPHLYSTGTGGGGSVAILLANSVDQCRLVSYARSFTTVLAAGANTTLRTTNTSDPYLGFGESTTLVSAAANFLNFTGAGGMEALGVALQSVDTIIEMTYAERVLDAGATSYWRLGETSGVTAFDVFAGYPLAIGSGVTKNQPGISGAAGNRAMLFDNSINHLAGSVDLALPAQFSIEAWIYPTSLVQHQTIWCNGVFSAGEVELKLQPAGNVVVIFLSSVTVTSAGVPSAGSWHHVVVTGDGTTLRLYVDGVLDGSAAAPSVTHNAGPLGIGFAPQANNHPFVGKIDEVAVYPSALSGAVIAEHYTAGLEAATVTGTGALGTLMAMALTRLAGENTVDSYNIWDPITPSDTVNLPRGICGGLWVGGGGDVAAVMGNNISVLLAAVPSGAWLPIAAKRINATLTTATGLVALYEV